MGLVGTRNRGMWYPNSQGPHTLLGLRSASLVHSLIVASTKYFITRRETFYLSEFKDVKMYSNDVSILLVGRTRNVKI